MTTHGLSHATRYLDVEGGRIAYDDVGEGPPLVATPAMLDQRGMGESSATWPAYGSVPLARSS